MTLVRVGLAPRAAGLSPDEAQAHWRTQHRDVALELPGLRGYVQNHAVLRDGRPLLPYPGFDVCAETEWDDLAGMRAAFASEQYRTAVRADESRLIDASRFQLVLARRELVADGEAPADAVKLMTFARAADGVPVERLLDALRAWAAPGALRHELLVADPAAHEGDRPPWCDAVDLVWFAHEDAALAAAPDRGRELEGVASATERAIVRPLRMR